MRDCLQRLWRRGCLGESKGSKPLDCDADLLHPVRLVHPGIACGSRGKPWSLKGSLARIAPALSVPLCLAMLHFNLLLEDWRSIEPWQFDRRLDFIAGNERNLLTALALESAARPGTSIAVVGTGTIPYLLPLHYAIDILGKTDPVIARGPIRQSLGRPNVAFLRLGNENRMRPGHMQWNYAHTLAELQPDVIVSLWDETLQEYVLVTIEDKATVFVRKDSPNILLG